MTPGTDLSDRMDDALNERDASAEEAYKLREDLREAQMEAADNEMFRARLAHRNSLAIAEAKASERALRATIADKPDWLGNPLLATAADWFANIDNILRGACDAQESKVQP